MDLSGGAAIGAVPRNPGRTARILAAEFSKGHRTGAGQLESVRPKRALESLGQIGIPRRASDAATLVCTDLGCLGGTAVGRRPPAHELSAQPKSRQAAGPATRREGESRWVRSVKGFR